MAALWDLGTTGVHTRDSGDALELLAYFPTAPSLTDLRDALGASATVEATTIPDVDWVARFREEFRGFRAGTFRVVPAWDVPADRDARTLVVDPGQAFGTGTHETTRLCLAWLESLGALGDVLDYGCGTGLLAIAALRLGATSAVAVDIDPDALDNARDHRRLNEAPVRLVLGDGARALRPSVFDTVVANVTGPMLRERAAEIAAMRRPGGRLVLSGLLAEEAPALTALFSAYGRVQRRDDGEWSALLVSA